MASPTSAFAGFEWAIAFRYLRPTRQRGFVSVISALSMLGIAMGVATLIIVMSVMNGFRSELLGRILGLNGHIVVQSVGGPGMPEYDAAAKRIAMVPGVVSAVPIVEGQVLANANTASIGALVRGIRAEDMKTLSSVYSSLSPNAMTDFNGGETVILGWRLANALGIAPGMNVTLVAPRGNVTVFGTTPRVKTYRVAGTFRVGMSEYDQSYIFMPLSEAQLFFGTGDTVSGIMIMVTDPDNVVQWRNPVATAAGPFVRVHDWEDQNSSLFGALVVERNVMFLILTMIILVAALNIISGLIMLVKDKNGDIAILRTMGATKATILRVFFIDGAFIGVVGTIAGLLLGLLICLNIENLHQFLLRSGIETFDPTIYFLSQIPSEIQAGDVIAVVAMSLTLSFLATLYPAWRASKLDPVEALRYE